MNLWKASAAYTALRQARAQLELDYRAGRIGLDEYGLRWLAAAAAYEAVLDDGATTTKEDERC